MKKILFSCLSLALMMMLWAFTQPRAKSERKHSVDATWYYYDGDGDPNDPTNYTPTGTIQDCDGSTDLCAILAEPDPLNNQIPREEDVEDASDASSNFTIVVPDYVLFKPAS